MKHLNMSSYDKIFFFSGNRYQAFRQALTDLFPICKNYFRKRMFFHKSASVLPYLKIKKQKQYFFKTHYCFIHISC